MVEYIKHEVLYIISMMPHEDDHTILVRIDERVKNIEQTLKSMNERCIDHSKRIDALETFASNVTTVLKISVKIAGIVGGFVSIYYLIKP